MRYKFQLDSIQDNLNDLDEIIEEAQQAFYKVLVDRYSLISGDLPVFETLEFDIACIRVAKALRYCNKKETK